MNTASLHHQDLGNIHSIVFDFDGVFTDNKVYTNSNGKEFVMCDRADGLGLGMLRSFLLQKALSIDLMIVSREINKVVRSRAKKLKLSVHQGVYNKLEFLKEKLAKNLNEVSDPFQGLIYLGNDLNDLSMIKHAQYSIVPCDAHPIVQTRATHILTKKGGHGFVREFIEHFINLEQLSIGDIDELISNR